MNHLLTQLPESRRWNQQSYPIPVVAAIIRRDQGDAPAYLLNNQDMAPTDYLILKHHLKAFQKISYVEAEVVTRSSGMLVSKVRRFDMTR